VRPAIVIGSNGHGDLFLVPVTSQAANIDVPLTEWQGAGLNVPCGIKAQLATVERRLVIRVLGRMSTVDQGVVDAQLRTWLAL